MTDTIRTPTLAEVIRLALDARLPDVRVAMPGRVESYDAATQTAEVLPLLKGMEAGADGISAPVSMPRLVNVPVLMPQGGGRQIKLPVAAGDVVLLVFADRGLDAWKSEGGEQDPVDDRVHHIADAMAIPCFRDPGAAVPESTIEIKADGSILLGPGAAHGVGLGDNLRTELDALWTALGSHSHPLSVPITGPAGTTVGATTGVIGATPAKQTVASANVKVIA